MPLLVLSLLAVAPVTAATLTLARIRAARTGDAPAPASAAVVLGAAAHDGRPCAELEARLARAAALWREGWAPVVVCSGGEPEALAMRDSLLAGGLPASAVIVDTAGVSTRATVERAAGRGRVLLVTSPWHVHRTRAEARRRGVDALVCSADRSPLEAWPRARRRQVAREVAASWWYALRAPRARVES